MSKVAKESLLVCESDLTPLVADLVGRPYSTTGVGPEGALSCWGLLREVYRRMGINLAEHPYPAEAMQMCAEVPCNQPGNAVVFKIADLPHVGVMVTRTKMIHSAPERGVTIEPLARFTATKRQLRPLASAVTGAGVSGEARR